MKLKKFASGFKNPGTPLWCGVEPVAPEKREVVIAGTIHSVTDTACRIDVNGAKYEIDAADVIDIEEIPAAAKPAGEEGAAEEAPPRAALITLSQNAILCRLMPVQAAVLAAMGTWMWVSAPVAEQGAADKGTAEAGA